jgi:hypothetical protein
MLASISYERFGANPQRAGFNSLKRVKSKKYLSVSDIEPSDNDVVDMFNQIEFTGQEDEQTIEQIYQEIPDTFEHRNEIKPPEPKIDHKEREILKVKAMLQFMQVSKSKNTEKKYARQI